MKAIQDQEEKQIMTLEENGKELIKNSDEKESLTNSKQKKYF